MFKATWEPHGPKRGLSADAIGPSSVSGAAPAVAWRCSVMIKDEVRARGRCAATAGPPSEAAASRREPRARTD